MKRLFLIDAYAIIYRSFYAFHRNPILNPRGENVSALFGFLRYLGEIISREQPDYLGVAFDPKGGSFRNQIFTEYKANRSETPEAIIHNTPILKDILRSMRVPIFEVSGYEADDVIGTLSAKASQIEGLQTFMVTPDKDYGQLLRENVFQYKPSKKGSSEPEIVSSASLCESYGLRSAGEFADILAIWGDASDNVPGVPGIGEKGATSLVSRWGDIENIISNVDQLTARQRSSISENVDRLRLAKELVLISLDVPVEVDLSVLERRDPDLVSLAAHYREQGFRQMLFALESRYGRIEAAPVVQSEVPVIPTTPPPTATPTHGMLSLFDAIEPPTPAAAAPQSSTSGGVSEQLSLFGEDMSVAENILAVAKDISSQTPIFDGVYRTCSSVDHNYQIVDSTDQLKALIGEIRSLGQFCFDTETTSIEAMRAELVGLSISIAEHSAWWIPSRREYLELLAPLFADKQITKIGQNIKYDILVLKVAGIEVKGFLYDTMIMHYLLNPESRHSMDSMARSLLHYDPIPIETLIGKGAKQITMDRVPTEQLAEYACEDADITLQLFNLLQKKLKEVDSLELYKAIEEPLIGVLTQMEFNGVHIDLEILGSTRQTLSERLTQIEDQIMEVSTNKELNINSPKQLGELLYDVLKLSDKPKKTKTGQYKTDEETLMSLKDKHPIVEKILEYRGLKKLLSTYIDALPELINPTTGQIHTSYNQAVTATGRLSSTNPNLQNIPIRDDNGREIRKAFVPKNQGWKIVAADYSQVELRIMAHLSGDKNMIEAFSKGEDIHSATAAKIYGVKTSEVSRDQRRKAKTANFGIIYGISAFGLSQRLDIPRKEAKELIEGYFTHFPQVKEYMDRVIAQAREREYVETIFGRRRFLADINSRNSISRSFAERNAVNAPIQGSGADIMKIAMSRVQKQLSQLGLRSILLMQVHDEVVLEVPECELDQVRELLIEQMSASAELSVPLEVEVGIGDNWLSAH
ncbi:MAG: DNA polymerase I [Rikenellaceae bacterium]